MQNHSKFMPIAILCAISIILINSGDILINSFRSGTFGLGELFKIMFTIVFSTVGVLLFSLQQKTLRTRVESEMLHTHNEINNRISQKGLLKTTAIILRRSRNELVKLPSVQQLFMMY